MVIIRKATIVRKQRRSFSILTRLTLVLSYDLQLGELPPPARSASVPISRITLEFDDEPACCVPISMSLSPVAERDRDDVVRSQQ